MSNPEDLYRPGELIGSSLEVTRVLGRGGFGVVYHVRSREDGREYALKTYLRSSSDRKAGARFRQEAEVWVSLGQHPHTVQAFFADEFDGRLFVAMEYIPEGPLGINSLDRLVVSRLPPLNKVTLWGIQICLGMEYARSRGIRSHRDLKPANIMVTPAGDAKITDFGLATFPGSAGDEVDLSEAQRLMEAFKGQTVRGMGFGTPTYMPPEQFEDAGACDERSDIYALGVILFQLLTGSSPFMVRSVAGSSLRSRMQYWKDMETAHRTFRMPPLDSPLEPVIERCLRIDPESRFQSFSDMRSDLQQIHTSLGGQQIEAPATPSMTGREWLERGNSFIALKRFSAALHCMDQAAERGESGAGVLSGKARSLSGLGRFLEALPCHDAAIALEPDRGDLLVQRGFTLMNAGFHDRAGQDFEQALVLDRGHVSALYGLGIIHEGREQWEKATSLLDRALERNSSRADILTDKGVLCLRRGDRKGAVESLNKALSVDEHYSRARRYLAAHFTDAGDHQKALAQYQLLGERFEMNRSDYLFRAIALCSSGQFWRAHESLGRVTGADLKPWVHLVRARILLMEHRFDEALEAQDLAMNGVEASLEMCLQQAIMLLYCGHSQAALDEARVLLDRSEKSAETAVLALCAAMDSGAPELGVELAQTTLDAGVSSVSLLYDQGLCLAALGNFASAMQAFRKAIDGRPYWPQAWANLAHAAFEMGDIDLGIQSLNRAWHYRESHAEFWSTSKDDLSKHHVSLDAVSIPVSPPMTIRFQSNGWSARYRLPQFEYPVLLFPVVNPSILIVQ